MDSPSWVLWIRKSSATWQFFSADCSVSQLSKHQSSSLLAFCEGKPKVTGGFPSQMATDTESVSMSWRHHEKNVSLTFHCTWYRKWDGWTGFYAPRPHILGTQTWHSSMVGQHWKTIINSLDPGRFQFNFSWVIFKITLVNGGWGISFEIAHRWMPLDLIDDKSILFQVMAWCRQATILPWYAN